MFTFVRRILPSWFIRFLGRLQFDAPLLAPVIRWAAKRSTAGVQTIQYGRASGLRIDNSLGFPGYATGTTEPEEQDALWRLLRPGDTFVNIGANIGFHALIGAKRVESSGKVIAVEPVNSVAEMIAKNASLNSFENITVIKAACSNHLGRATIYSGDSTATNSLIRERTQGNNEVEVEMTTVDELVKAHDLKPSLLSIDIEGAEIECLEGSRKTLEAFRPVIMLENHWLQAPFYEFFDRELFGLGYTLENLDGSEYVRTNTSIREHIVARVAS